MIDHKHSQKRFLAGWQRIFSLSKEWDDLNESSRSEATGIVNTILELEHLEVPSSWASINRPEAFPHLLARIEGKVWENVRQKCESLHAHLDLLADIVVSMKMEAAELIELSLIPFRIKSVQPPDSSNSSSDQEPALFLVTSLPSLVAQINQLVQCYVQELELKVGMALDLTKTRDRTVLTAYLSAWTLEIFVGDAKIQELADQIDTESVLASSSSH